MAGPFWGSQYNCVTLRTEKLLTFFKDFLKCPSHPQSHQTLHPLNYLYQTLSVCLFLFITYRQGRAHFSFFFHNRKTFRQPLSLTPQEALAVQCREILSSHIPVPWEPPLLPSAANGQESAAAPTLHGPKKKNQLLLGLFQKKDEVLADEQEAPQLFIMPFDALRCSRLLRSQKIWGHETALEH